MSGVWKKIAMCGDWNAVRIYGSGWGPSESVCWNMGVCLPRSRAPDCQDCMIPDDDDKLAGKGDGDYDIGIGRRGHERGRGGV